MTSPLPLLEGTLFRVLLFYGKQHNTTYDNMLLQTGVHHIVHNIVDHVVHDALIIRHTSPQYIHKVTFNDMELSTLDPNCEATSILQGPMEYLKSN